MIEWKKVESEALGNLWLPEQKGDELVGTVEKREEGTYGVQFTIKKDDGSLIKTPSHKVLQNRMAKLALGQMVKLVFTGEIPPKIRGENPTKLYELYVQE